MAQYRIYDDGGASETIEADTIEDAERVARDWAREGDWPLDDGTTWVTVRLYEVVEDDGDDGDEVEAFASRITVTIDPEPPACREGEDHDWRSPYHLLGGVKENPGVWGHGGGVIIRDVCGWCGVYRITDTWAQHPETGEQGLESVRYEEADHASRSWCLGIEPIFEREEDETCRHTHSPSHPSGT